MGVHVFETTTFQPPPLSVSLQEMRCEKRWETRETSQVLTNLQKGNMNFPILTLRPQNDAVVLLQITKSNEIVNGGLVAIGNQGCLLSTSSILFAFGLM